MIKKLFNRLIPLFFSLKRIMTKVKRLDDPEFKAFPHIRRFSRECIITEKIDGTNAQIFITPIHKNHYNNSMISYFYGEDASTWGVYAGSRSRWLTPGKHTDNYGFAQWVKDNVDELKKLGPGRHYGEWYGQGINRNYGLKEKRFVLFNVDKYGKMLASDFPKCVTIVPILRTGILSSDLIHEALQDLIANGSKLVPGYMRPEGIVIFHCASNILLKKTIEQDEQPKGKI